MLILSVMVVFASSANAATKVDNALVCAKGQVLFTGLKLVSVLTEGRNAKLDKASNDLNRVCSDYKRFNLSLPTDKQANADRVIDSIQKLDVSIQEFVNSETTAQSNYSEDIYGYLAVAAVGLKRFSDQLNVQMQGLGDGHDEDDHRVLRAAANSATAAVEQAKKLLNNPDSGLASANQQ